MTVAMPPPPGGPSGPARAGSGGPTPVVTPEAVPLELQIANIGSRSLALTIDLLIIAGAAIVLFFGFTAALQGTDPSLGLVVAAMLLLSFLLIWGYPVIQETLWRGRTVGKAALGLRVVTKEGAPITFRHAAIRASLGLVDFWLTSGAVAVLSVLLTRDSQRLGDLAAGTLVLRERSGLRPVTPVGFAVPYGMEGYAATLDLAGLTADDYRAVRAFLLRAQSLPYHVRAHLALQLADPIAIRVRPRPPEGTVPEAFLATVAAVYQRRQGASRPAPPSPPVPPAAPTPTPAPPAPAATPLAPTAPAPPSPAPGDGGFAPPA